MSRFWALLEMQSTVFSKAASSLVGSKILVFILSIWVYFMTAKLLWVNLIWHVDKKNPATSKPTKDSASFHVLGSNVALHQSCQRNAYLNITVLAYMPDTVGLIQQQYKSVDKFVKTAPPILLNQFFPSNTRQPMRTKLFNLAWIPIQYRS